MKRPGFKTLILLFAIIILLLITGYNYFKTSKIIYPFEKVLFPPEYPSPTFRWKDKDYNGKWIVNIISNDHKFKIHDKVAQSNWTPTKQQWEILKTQTHDKIFWFSVKRASGFNISSKISLQFSRDSVNAPILYRQIPIPFIYAEKHLDSMNYRLINIGSYKSPHYAMKGFMVCGNCHSFTQDGHTIGLDLDAGLRDKGGYFISPIKDNDTITFDINNYMSWTRLSKGRTFGLFSKLSPNGQFVVTTVKDRIIDRNFPYDPKYIPFSQLFFPVNGHLAIYDRKNHKFFELPGANLDEYVQTNAIWSPDGKFIIFARAKSLPRNEGNNELSVRNESIVDQFVERKLSFKYNLYIIPFNNGNGGKALPIEGASDNGKSNYFPAISPDGKWIVFCQAENFMLLMPDSKLFIVPFKGGQSKMLNCNLSLFNSWHTWSPNSKWIAFSSKGLSIYTDLFLSHIDENGNASKPILVERARDFNRVINYPEFVNRKPDNLFTMNYDYVEIAHIQMAVLKGEKAKAIQLFHKLEKQNQIMIKEDYLHLSKLLTQLGLLTDAKRYTELYNKQK